ncbi:hypothetical protein B4135_4059 [Caldibacillus debilis]|uniref:Uncharacterized protein n=1 Tax=Caldibacillus debilis TaxID=301148 RepID=A0A150L7Q6_9BACI|nr:hypothetical protein B4135_4059 [Caldibacillus debilis]
MFAVFSGRICKKFYKLSSSWSGINGKIFSGALPYVIRNFPVSNKRAADAGFAVTAFLPVLFPVRHVPFFHFL